MSKGFKNSRKDRFLKTTSDSDCKKLLFAERSKFNFSFFIGDQNAGQSISDWATANGSASLEALFDKLKNYSQKPLSYWQKERAGGGGLKVLEIYGDFPKNSDFIQPEAVPQDVRWGRFRLGNKVRLIGFTIPPQLHGDEVKDGSKTYYLCKNTFYVVFFDKEHVFYKTGEAD